MRFRSSLLLGILILTACTKKSEPASAPVSPVEAGRKVYMANCIACHATDPKKDGTLGPSVWGSSLELLESRVLHASYPPGYAPKRPGQAMVALPHLKNEIPSLHAFLNSSSN